MPLSEDIIAIFLGSILKIDTTIMSKMFRLNLAPQILLWTLAATMEHNSVFLFFDKLWFTWNV